jgi:hypothetical protein
MSYLPVQNLGTPFGVLSTGVMGVKNITSYKGLAPYQNISIPGWGPPWTLPRNLNWRSVGDSRTVNPTWNPGYAYGFKGMLWPSGGGGGGGTVGYPI